MKPLVLLCLSLLLLSDTSVPTTQPHIVLRGSLKNSRIRFEREKTGRVAFLGGSITASPGWRDLVGKALQARFADTKLDLINAGNPSMGSTPDAFRLERDVFARGRVDLLFIDAAANDHINAFPGEEQVRGMEGIVRHARELNPEIDIVVLHFVEESMIESYDRGKTPEVIANHERVAAHYGLPSLDMPREMSRGIAAKEYTWAQFGGVHPSPWGHEFYAKHIGSLLDAAWAAPLENSARVTPHALPAKPIDPHSYFHGRLMPVSDLKPGDGWKIDPAWKPTDKLETRAGFVGVPTLLTETPGAITAIPFEGPTIGIFVAAGKDAGIVEFSIDGGPWRSRDIFTGWSPYLHLPWAHVLDGDLTPGKHEIKLRSSAKHNPASSGHAIRIMHILVNDQPKR